jgi:membrane protease YdiL (CAAX protease family)
VSAACSSATQPSLLGACLLVTSVWLALLLGQVALSVPLGREVAVLLSFACAAALVLALPPRHWGVPERRDAWAFALGALAGLASWPAWIELIAVAGTALSLPRPSASRGEPTALVAVGSLLLAPVFEEVLYRERLLGALRTHLGSAAAVLLSSAAFALAHVEPWAVLGTFLVGLALGAVMCLWGRLALCIGLHAGLNAAALLA